MIPIFNTKNEVEFEMCLGRKFIYSPSSKIKNISLYDAKSEDSQEVKLFIKDIFQNYYQAEIEVTFPILMAILDKNNNILAALGFRFADREKLFLEQYVDDPAEKIVSSKYQVKANRNQIAEIGALASRGSGMSKFLFIAICAYLRKINYNFCMMTGTHKLRKNFKKLNLKPKIVCDARPERLNNFENWGTYYDNSPKVMTGDINSSYKILKTILNISVIPSLTQLYPYDQNL